MQPKTHTHTTSLEEDFVVINIIEAVFKTPDLSQWEKIYASKSFSRKVLKSECLYGYLRIIQDNFLDGDYTLFQFSYNFNVGQKVRFILNGEEIEHQEVLDKKTFIYIRENNNLFLIPGLPVIRQKNDNKNIVREKADYYIRYDKDQVIFEAEFLQDESFEFILLGIPRHEDFNPYDLYKDGLKRYALTGPWVEISPLLDCWKFMVNGKIYEYTEEFYRYGEKTKLKKYVRSRSQSAALFLYKLISIQENYSKNLAKIIKDEIAYSVMLDLEPDGRWFHGIWGDETHARYQVDGIHLLLDYYVETTETIFLEKALLAANYLLSIADKLNGDSLWFMHDTLELNRNSHNASFLKSRAFGKSLTNTLALNTHLCTICALIRLYDLTGDERLKTAIEKGIKAAQMVLDAEPATSFYRTLYYFVDLKFDLSSFTSGKFLAIKELPKLLIKKAVQVLLPYVKNLFPRLVMPNGYITRDISLRSEPYYYHILNLYDMLVLYQLLYLHGYRDINWLWDKIERGVDYCLKGNQMRALIAREYKRQVPQLIEVLIMYLGFNENFDKGILANTSLTLADKRYKFTSGSYGFDNLVTPEKHKVPDIIAVKTHSPYVEIFDTSSRINGIRELIVINTGVEEEEIEVFFKDNTTIKLHIEILTSNNKKIEGFDQVIGPRDYLFIRLKQ